MQWPAAATSQPLLGEARGEEQLHSSSRERAQLPVRGRCVPTAAFCQKGPVNGGQVQPQVLCLWHPACLGWQHSSSMHGGRHAGRKHAAKRRLPAYACCAEPVGPAAQGRWAIEFDILVLPCVCKRGVAQGVPNGLHQTTQRLVGAYCAPPAALKGLVCCSRQPPPHCLPATKAAAEGACCLRVHCV